MTRNTLQGGDSYCRVHLESHRGRRKPERKPRKNKGIFGKVGVNGSQIGRRWIELRMRGKSSEGKKFGRE